LIIDALDECDKSARVVLIETLNRLVNSIPNLKILILSQWDDDIKRKLKEKAKLEVDATKNQEDIKKFVLAKLNEDAADRSVPFTDQLRRDIVEVLFKKSEGM
jgi:ankyrin repeat domain-containing protein 50